MSIVRVPDRNSFGTLSQPQIPTTRASCPSPDADRLSGCAMAFMAHGAAIRLRANDPSILEAVAAALPTGAAPCTATVADVVYTWEVKHGHASAPLHVVTMHCRRFTKGKEIARTADLAQALALFRHDAEFRIAIYSPRDVFIHAAVVAWHGRAIVIPGHSFAGKSTLTAELVRQGAPYFSDEYAVIAPDGSIHPFPRSVMLRRAPSRTTYPVTVEDLGGTRGVGALPLGAVVATRYELDARWEPRSLSRGEMVLALLEHAIDVEARPEHVLHRIAGALHERVIGLRGDRGDAGDTARALLARLTASWAIDARAAS